MADLQFRRIKEEQEYWQQELDDKEVLRNNDEAALTSFGQQMKELKLYDMFGFDGNITTEQKKRILNLLLNEYILYNDGKVELRFKIPANKEQVTNTIVTFAQGDKAGSP